MDRKDVIRILRNYKKEISEQYDIARIGIFGSMARDEATDESDVDAVISVSEPDFFMLAGIKNDLEERFSKSVDIIRYKNTMNPYLKDKIDREAIYA